jgi:hypothetical protein
MVLELMMGPRMARSIFFRANLIFRSASVLVLLTGVTGVFSLAKGILTINNFLGDVLGDFFFLPKGNLTMSFWATFLGNFLLGGRRIRRGGTF